MISKLNPAVRVGLSYIILVSLWIIFTHLWLVNRQPDTLRILAVFFLVVASGGLVAVLTWRAYQTDKQADTARREADNLFASLLDVTTDAIIHIGSDQRISFINRGAEEMFGYRAVEIFNQPLERLFPLRESASHHQLIQSLIAEDSEPDYAIIRQMATGQRKDGTEFPIAVSLARLKVEDSTSFMAIVHDITEQVQAEQEVRRSETHLRQVVENMPIMLFAMDADGNILVWNRECERVTGYQADEIVGTPRTLSILYPDKDYLLNVLVKWGEQGNNFRDWALDITCKDGRVKTIAWANVSDEFPIAGWATWLVGIDVTEHRQAEQSLQEERNFVSTILDTVGSLVVVMGKDGRIVTFNKTCQQITGYAFNEVQGKLIWDLFIIPEEIEAVKAVFQDLRAGNFPSQYENYWLTKDGNRRLIAWANTAIVDDTGKVAHVIGTGVDITERRQSEEQIRYQANLLQNVSDAIISADRDFNIRTWNKAAERIYGWKATEVIGKSADDILFPRYMERAGTEEVAKRLSDTGEWEGEVIQLRKDGTPVHILAAITHMRDSKGNLTGAVSVNRDITELKRMQEQVFQAELQQMEFEKEKEVVKLKEQFMSMVSHEFRTPLTIILAAADLIRNYYDRLAPEKRLKHIQEIMAQTQYMSGLLDDVLLFSRGSAGKLEFDPEPVDVNAFCHDLAEQMLVMDEDRHQWVFDCTVTDQRYLDQKLLQHILGNLISNAAKYSPAGGEIVCQSRSDGDDIVFRISDQGIGIPRTDQERLYEPFFRAGNRGDVNGTGLGLAIVKSCVDRHGGTIFFESKEGVGTTFTVRLPAKVHSPAP